VEADTIRAEEDIYVLERGPSGGWEAHIMTEAEVAEAEKDLNDTARTRDSEIRVLVKYRYYDPLSGEYKWSSRYVKPGDDVTGGTGRSIIVPPAEGGGSPPSMISPGGPTTMGFMDSFTPFADQRANRFTGPGVMGKPNYWGSDDSKSVKNITINNYYPEPERASDSIAMSLRAARYGG
jgi:hypothetical protein